VATARKAYRWLALAWFWSSLRGKDKEIAFSNTTLALCVILKWHKEGFT
jgi:hypothetical protein